MRDWKARLVGFGSDGAAVNLGSKSGVAARLKQEVEYLVSIHCTAHILELGVVGAIKQHPKMANLQEVFKSLFRRNFSCNSFLKTVCSASVDNGLIKLFSY